MKQQKRFPAFGLLITSFFLALFANAANAQQSAPAPALADTEYQAAAVLYMQKAAEYRALCYQAWNAARDYLDTDFEKKNLKKLPKEMRKMPRAIVVDIDETVLDNSPAQAYGVKNRQGFELKSWYAWGEMRKAKAIPGAADFLNYANSKGVKVFYVSNRDEVQRQATADNLKAAGFPDVTGETLLLRDKESTKEPRRQLISSKYRIEILAGDNLDDLSDVFEKKSVADRFAETDKMRETFGKRFIVLPNSMYGTWENAVYEYQRLNDAQKAQKRIEALELPK